MNRFAPSVSKQSGNSITGNSFNKSLKLFDGMYG